MESVWLFTVYYCTLGRDDCFSCERIDHSSSEIPDRLVYWCGIWKSAYKSITATGLSSIPPGKNNYCRSSKCCHCTYMQAFWPLVASFAYVAIASACWHRQPSILINFYEPWILLMMPRNLVLKYFIIKKRVRHNRNTFVHNREQCNLRRVAIRDYSIPMPDCLHVQSLIWATMRPTHHSS